MAYSGLNLLNSRDLVVNSIQLQDSSLGIVSDIRDIINVQVQDVSNNLTAFTVSSVSGVSTELGGKITSTKNELRNVEDTIVYLNNKYKAVDASLNNAIIDLSGAVTHLNQVSSVVNHPTLGNSMLGAAQATTQSLASQVQVEVITLSGSVSGISQLLSATRTEVNNVEDTIVYLNSKYRITDASLNQAIVDLSGAVDKINQVNSVVNHPTLGNGMLGAAQATTQSLASQVQVELRSLSSVVDTKAPIASPSFTGTVNINDSLFVQNGITAHNLRLADDLLLFGGDGSCTCTYLTATQEIKQGNLKLYEYNPSSATGRKGLIVHPSRIDVAISSSTNPTTSESYVVMAGNEIYLKNNTFVTKDLKVFGNLKTGNLKLFDDDSVIPRGQMIHPNGLNFFVSSLDTPTSSENYLSLADGIIELNKDCTVNGDINATGYLTGGYLSVGNRSIYADANGVTCKNLIIPATGTVTGFTKAMVGLGNVDNTSDGLKPVSIPQQQAINVVANKANSTEILFNTFLNSYMPPFVNKVDDISTKVIDLSTRVDLLDGGTAPAFSLIRTQIFNTNQLALSNASTISGLVAKQKEAIYVDKDMVGLGNVDNTSDISKPISIATQAALTTLTSSINTISGRVDDNENIMYGNFNAITDSIYTNDWNTQNAISDISSAIASLRVGALTGLTSANVGLGNVNNTSDINKPISTATQTALNTLSGTITTVNTGLTTLKTNLNTYLTLSGTTTINTDASISGNLYSNYDSYVYGKIGQGTNTPESALHVTGNRKNIPTMAGIHAGYDGLSSSQSVTVCSQTTGPGALEFTTAGATGYKGKLNYLHTTNQLQIHTNGAQQAVIDSSGRLGVGITAPTSSLQVGGLIATTLASGVNCGMLAASTNSAMVAIVAALGSVSSYLAFAYNGRTYTQGGFIQYSHGANGMYFYTAGAAAMTLDSNQTVLIGTQTSQPTYKLYVNGNSYFNGTTSASGTKTFDISHPIKEGYRLRHRCIESPEPYLMYQYQEHCNVGENSFDLPDYFSVMNSDAKVYVSPYKHFGAGWGDVVENTLYITASTTGTYNIQVIGVRSDQIALDEFETYGVEYKESK